MSGPRILSDEDVDAIAAALENRLEERFMVNLGKGVWGLFWKALIVLLVAIAAYGAVKTGGVLPHETGVPKDRKSVV